MPVRGGDQIILLAHLAHDADSGVAESASGTLKSLPDDVVEASLGQALPAAVLHYAASVFKSRERLLGAVVGNAVTANATVELIARDCSEMTSERIATNQQRMIAEPSIIEALYKNPSTRMSTAERIVEFAVRQGLKLEGIHTFAAHVESALGVPEPAVDVEPQDELVAPVAGDDTVPEIVYPIGGDGFLGDGIGEATGADELFLNALGALNELDDDEGGEHVSSNNKPIQHQIREMAVEAR